MSWVSSRSSSSGAGQSVGGFTRTSFQPQQGWRASAAPSMSVVRILLTRYMTVLVRGDDERRRCHAASPPVTTRSRNPGRPRTRASAIPSSRGCARNYHLERCLRRKRVRHCLARLALINLGVVFRVGLPDLPGEGPADRIGPGGGGVQAGGWAAAQGLRDAVVRAWGRRRLPPPDPVPQREGPVGRLLARPDSVKATDTKDAHPVAEIDDWARRKGGTAT